MFEAHFQSFDDRSDRAETESRVAALRAQLQLRGLDGFIVPRADRFQNEYVPTAPSFSSMAAIRCRCGRKSTTQFSASSI
jgi:hypothetical protein